MNKRVKKLLAMAVCAAMLLECNAVTVFAAEVGDEVSEIEVVTEAESASEESEVEEVPEVADEDEQESDEGENKTVELKLDDLLGGGEQVENPEDKADWIAESKEWDYHMDMIPVDGGWVSYDWNTNKYILEELYYFDQEEVVIENNNEMCHIDEISVGGCSQKLKNTRRLVIKDFDVVYGFSNCPNLEEVVIIGAKEVGGFTGCPKLKKIVLDNKLESCYCNGFGDADIQFEDGITVLPAGMYKSSTRKSIEIPDTIKKIGKEAFADCKELEKINIPDSVEDIESSAFRNCVKLTELKLPKNLKNLGSCVISGCMGITEITIPKSLESAGELRKSSYGEESYYASSGPFDRDSGLEKAFIEDGMTKIPDTLFYSCRRLKEVSIPDSVENIGKYAFYYSGIENIHLPCNLTFIDYKAFNDCDYLNEITIPENVISIAYGAFESCNKLNDAYILSRNVSFGRYAFSSYYTKRLHGYKGSTTEEFAKKDKFEFIDIDEEVKTPEEPKSIADLEFSYKNNFDYTGVEIKPSVDVLDAGKRLTRGKNFTISYSSNTDVGIGTITITGVPENGYEGTKELTFNINPYKIVNSLRSCIEITCDRSAEYNKYGAKPTVTVTFTNGRGVKSTLQSGTDYTLSYKDNKNYGGKKKPTVTVKGKGNFTGSRSFEYIITERNISKTKVRAADRPSVLKANDYKTTIELKDSGKVLVAGVDYEENIQYVYAKKTIVKVSGKKVTRKAGEAVGSKDVIPGDTVIKVIVTAKKGSGYTGTVTATYNLDSIYTIYKNLFW